MQRRKIKMTIGYDGTDYHGWQVQPGYRTLQQTLCEAATALLGRKTHVHGASRTDAGVHALGQSGLIEVASPIPTENFPKALTDRLPEDIAVTEACEVDRGFDLMGDVTRKLYRYTLYVSKPRPVLKSRFCWHLPGSLDIAAMQQAAGHLVGEHNFKSMASSADTRQSAVRTLFRCDVTEEIEGLNHCVRVDVEGNAFLYNMVRNIVGTLVDFGRGRWNADHMPAILAARDRNAAGQLAPARGLCLMWVRY